LVEDASVMRKMEIKTLIPRTKNIKEAEHGKDAVEYLKSDPKLI